MKVKVAGAWVDVLAVPTNDAVATVEELVGQRGIADSISSTLSWHLTTALFGLSVMSLSVVTTSGVAASNTDYWTLDLRRFRAGSSVTIATKNTRADGGGIWSANTDWNFDSVAFDPSNKVLLKGDILNLNFTKTGAPAALGRTTASWRYEPT